MWNSCLPTCSTSRGFTWMPLSATVENAEAIWSAVTAMPCPMGMLPMEESDQSLTGATLPPTSPGNCTPVGLPNP